MKVKKCKVCGETKPLDQFGIDHRMSQNRSIYCKPCRAAKSRNNKLKKRDAISVICQLF